MDINNDFWAALFALLGVTITSFLLPWLKCKAKTEQQKQYIVWAEQAVKCAETLLFDKGGAVKKQFALKYS